MIADALRGPGVRRAATAVGLLLLGASALIGSGAFGLRDRLLGSVTPSPRPPAVSRSADDPTGGRNTPEATVLRSQPWWQRVDVVRGTGATSARITIGPGAIQWRVGWRCEEGRLVVRASIEPQALVDAACPGQDFGYGVRTGRTALEVTADGPWELVVEQQLDVPLEEPPLPEMTAPGADRVATASLYGMEKTGTGRAIIYRLPDGRHALRLANFYVTPNVDLEVRFSPLRAPKTTREFLGADSVWVAPLDITAGSLNFSVPRAVDPSDYRSLVIWCPPLQIAYAAGTLRLA